MAKKKRSRGVPRRARKVGARRRGHDPTTEHPPLSDGANAVETVAERGVSTSAPLTVVAIGASAGGLEAITQLLQHLRPDTGMAYVVVQHLAPRHESMLPQLLRASSPIPVVQVREGMTLEPNRVHVIPPNVEMTVIGGRLHLAPRPKDASQHTPIDSFLRSLAEYTEGRAIGIVLSGSASDGSLGLRELKSAGGITIAQDPRTAKFDGMPRAAIATGVVDLVLTPEQIAQELMRLGDHPFLSVPAERDQSEDTSFDEQQMETLFHLLRNSSGVDFSHYKLPTIKRRLQRRMLLHKTTALTDYLRVLESDPLEVTNLYRDILIHVTRFFRDPDSFEALEKKVFPGMVKDADGKRPIRIWIPGCATGEEAYSVAIALLEQLGDEATSIPLQIFATDVSQEAIDQARLGMYPESIVADVSPARLRRFFSRIDGQYRISKIVRDSCIFARQDLTRDPPFSKLDLIVCRNVLIYLDARLQRRLMNVFHYALKPSGFLALGATESTAGQPELFAVHDKKHRIYTKRAARGRGDFELTPVVEGFERELPRQPRPVRAPSRQGHVQSEVTRVLVGRYSPPAVVVDSDFQIIQTRGKTGPFLELATGDASLNLLKMAREGLLHGLRNALQEARQTLKPTRRDALLVRLDGDTCKVDLQVVPIGDATDTPYFLVLFEEAHHERSRRVQRGGTRKRTGTKDDRIAQMQHELTTSREYLQSIIQDLESANEELQSANEEILSSNEELQSTNEELDTAKEELQSTNEELNTVNDELNARNDELSHVNADLLNLLASVPAAIVIVTSDLRIRRFTPMAEQVLNLIPSDVGRRLGDLRPNVSVPDLAELTREVIDTETIKELEGRDRAGRRLAVRIRPYKNQENKIEGAVLAFADLPEIKGYDSPAAVRDLLDAFVRSVSAAVMILGEDLRVLEVNQALLSMIAASDNSVLGRSLAELSQRQWDTPSLMAALDRMRVDGQPFNGLALQLSQSDPRKLLIDGRLLPGTSSRVPMIVLTVRTSPVNG